MRNNITTFCHPTVITALRHALWLARLKAVKMAKAGTCGKATEYVKNRKGNNYLRIDVSTDRRVTIWGDNSRVVTSVVLASVLKARG